MADKKIIEARVIQKIDTEANWMANPLILYKGEQAFVSDKNNFKIGDGTKTFSQLEYYYKGDILGSVSTTDDLNAKPDGVYRAQTSGTYSGIVVKEGYYTLLRKTGTDWTLESEVKMPISDIFKGSREGLVPPSNKTGVKFLCDTGEWVEVKGGGGDINDLPNYDINLF